MTPTGPSAGSAAESDQVPYGWQADLGDGRYRNPILHADYSDPDAIRVGDDYYLTASSFTCVPGLPLLHSRDLVNWRPLGHALPRLVPEEHFRVPRHGGGVWAPAIRHHAGRFWIFYPDPDFGIYAVTADDPAGPWSAPVLVRGGRGLIDPCPFWDERGCGYLLHGWAKSRSGICNRLTLLRLSADSLAVEEDLGVVLDGDLVPGCTTLEGPKLYRCNGWCYVFAPAGGVATGWQSVFRARQWTGPYEHRIVLAQGRTEINGPHQGALVDTPGDEWWFLHFQDRGPYGRIVHLQPVDWRDDWPVIGDDADGDGTGEPVRVHRKPALPRQLLATLPVSDEFSTAELGLQWQWQANPEAGWLSLTARPGWLRLTPQPEPPGGLYDLPSLLLQKLPGPEFDVTTKLQFDPTRPGLETGLMVFARRCAWLTLRVKADGVALVWREKPADSPSTTVEAPLPADALSAREIWLRVQLRETGRCGFATSTDGNTFHAIGPDCTVPAGHWIGAKVGLFAMARSGTKPAPVDFDFFRVTPP